MSFEGQMLEHKTHLISITLQHLLQRALHRKAIRTLEIRELNDRHRSVFRSPCWGHSIVQLPDKRRRREGHPDGPLLSQRIEPGAVMLHTLLILEIETQTLARFVR